MNPLDYLVDAQYLDKINADIQRYELGAELTQADLSAIQTNLGAAINAFCVNSGYGRCDGPAADKPYPAPVVVNTEPDQLVGTSQGITAFTFDGNAIAPLFGQICTIGRAKKLDAVAPLECFVRRGFAATARP